jgi:AcrR family transcriptional regulator
MSPMPPPSRHDATGQQFLKAAVQLIDAYLDDKPNSARPARLRSIHFPAAFDWLRIEDVIRLAAVAGAAGASRKAFFNRWPTRSEFLPDALVYALAYDEVAQVPNEHARQVPDTANSPVAFSQEVIRIADGLLESLSRYPRSYLTLHIGPLLTQHPRVWEALLPEMRAGIQAWADGYAFLLTELGLVLRPGWTPHRLALALQAATDGFLLRYRIMPADYQTSTWENAGLFADTVIALIVGIIDTDKTGQSCREILDRLTARSS